MQINGGQDIVVTGGRYGQDATDNSMTTSGAIAVTGPAVRVLVVGADCSGKFQAEIRSRRHRINSRTGSR